MNEESNENNEKQDIVEILDKIFNNVDVNKIASEYFLNKTKKEENSHLLEKEKLEFKKEYNNKISIYHKYRFIRETGIVIAIGICVSLLGGLDILDKSTVGTLIASVIGYSLKSGVNGVNGRKNSAD